MSASDSNDFYSILQPDSIGKYTNHKYFINFPIYQLTDYSYPTNMCLEFSSGHNVALETKDIDFK